MSPCFFPWEQKILHLLLLSDCWTTCMLAQSEWASRTASQNRIFIPSCLNLNPALHFQCKGISFGNYCMDSIGAATGVLRRKRDQPQAFLLVSGVHDPAENHCHLHMVKKPHCGQEAFEFPSSESSASWLTRSSKEWKLQQRPISCIQCESAQNMSIVFHSRTTCCSV